MNKKRKKLSNNNFSRRLSIIVDLMFGGSQRALASCAGVTPQAINTYINPPRGKQRLPKSNELFRLASACGLSMEELLTGKKNTRGGRVELARWRDRALLAEKKLSMVRAGLSGMLKKI